MGRLYVDSRDGVYLTEVSAALNVLEVSSELGAVRLTVNDSARAQENLNMMSSGQTQLGAPIASGLITAPLAVEVWAGDDVTVAVGTLIRSDVRVEIHGDSQNLMPAGNPNLASDGDSDIGSTIDIRGDVQAPTVEISGGNDLDYIQLNTLSGINAGGATVLRGNAADDRFFVRGVSDAAGTTTTLQGDFGADRYLISSNATKALFSTGGSYNDDAPLGLLAGELTHLGGLHINTGDPGFGVTRDGIYLSAGSSAVPLSGTLEAGSVSGLGLAAPITYTTGAAGAALHVELGSGADTMQVNGMASNMVAFVYGGAGNDVMNAGAALSPVGGNISGIVAFFGEADADTLNVYGDASTTAGQLSAISVTGMGMGTNDQAAVHNTGFGAVYDIGEPAPAAIYFGIRSEQDGIESVASTVEVVNVLLGDNNDTFNIDSTYAYGTSNVNGGLGNDTLTVGSTPAGLHPAFLRRVDFVSGVLHLNGGDAIDGNDVIVVDDSGDNNANVGAYLGDRVTGLDMVSTGAIIFDAPDDITINLGGQTDGDTFYVPATIAELTTKLNTGGGHDKVYVGTTQGHESEGTLDNILGEFRIDGDSPEADDELYLNDQNTTSNQTFTVSNELEPLVTLLDGRDWRYDTTTVERTGGMHNIYYRRMETVVLNAGQGDDTFNLHSTHREQSDQGGKNSTFTVNAGGGDDLMHLGTPVGGGYSLASFSIFIGSDPLDLPTPDDIRGIPVMLNGQAGNDSVHFNDSASTADTNLAFVRKTFADIFPLDPEADPVEANPQWVEVFTRVFGEDPENAGYATVVLSEQPADPEDPLVARPLNVNARASEHVIVSLGSGEDVAQLTRGVHNYDITVYAGAGDDTFNIEGLPEDGAAQGFDNRGYVATLNGEEGDDLMFAQFEHGVPNATASVVFNGGPSNMGGGDTLRIAGDGVATGSYTPSSTEARAGEVEVGGNTFDFTGVEPLVVHGLSDFDVATGNSAADLVIDTVDVADLHLSNLVLHTLTIDGVVSWTQQAQLVTPAALETKHMGTVSAISGDTLVIGAELEGSSSGVVYVYTWNTATARWVEQAKLYAVDRSNGGAGFGFGKSVAIDGNLLIVGAPGDNTFGTNAGAAYVFVRNVSTGAWTQEAKIKPTDGTGAANRNFGISVAISGSSAVIGSVGAGSIADAAYVFVRSSGSWSQQQRIALTSDNISNFGAAVGITGSTLVVGAPLSGSIDIGAAYVFNRFGSTWTQATQNLTPSNPNASEHFGAAVDMVAGRIVVGSPDWNNPEHDFTTSSPDDREIQQGTRVLVMDGYNPSLGQAGTVYTYNGGAVTTLDLDSQDYLNTTLWLPSTDNGRAFVFEGGFETWTRIARLTAEGGLPEAEALLEGRGGDRFGATVAIDGDYVAVGAPGYDGDAIDQGAAYMFYRLPDTGWGTGASWTRATGYQEHSFTAQNSTQVASVTKGTQVLVGDSYDQGLGKRGSVYRYIGDTATLNLGIQDYTAPNGNWREVPGSGRLTSDFPAGSSTDLPPEDSSTVTLPAYATADRFGSSVAVGNGRLVIGLPGYNETNAAGTAVLRFDVGAVRTYSTDSLLPSVDASYWAEVLADPLDQANATPLDTSRFGSVTHYDPASRMLFVADPGSNVVYTYVNEGLYWRPVQTIASPDSVFITADGLSARYYDIPSRSSLPTSFAGLTQIGATQKEFAVYKGITGGSFAPIALNPPSPPTTPPTESDTFAAQWTGNIWSDIGQIVTFRLTSDDGSQLYVDNNLSNGIAPTLIVNNDGLHGMSAQEASVFLNAGLNFIDVRFFENFGGAGIKLEYRIGSGAYQLLTGPFGKDIDVDGNWMVIGAPDAKAYVYQRFDESWLLWQELSGAGGFGTSVAIAGSKLVVGMPSAPVTYASAGQADPNYNLNLGAAGGAVVFNRSGSFWSQERLLMPDDSGLPLATSYRAPFSPSDWNQVHIEGKGWYGIGGHAVNEGNGTEVILKPWMMMAAVDYNGGDWHAWWLFNFSGSDSTQYLPGSIDDDIEFIIVGTLQNTSGVYAELRRDGVIYTYYTGAASVGERNDSYMAVGPHSIAMAFDISGGDAGFHYAENPGTGEYQVTMSSARNDDIDYIAVASTRPVTTTRTEYNAFTGLAGARWGSSVDIIGNTVYVGAPNESRVAVYNLLAGDYSSWSTTIGNFTDAPLRTSRYFDASGQLGTEVVGVPGSTEFFASRPGSNIVQQYFSGGSVGTALGTPGFGGFGADETLSINGNRMLFGATGGNGRAYLYNSGEILQQTYQPYFYNTAPSVDQMRADTNSALHFGTGGQIISQGFVTVGTANATTDANKLYNFRQRGADWTPVANDLLVPEAIRKSEAGSSVAIDGDTAVVAARDYDNRGAVFVYIRDGIIDDDDNGNGIFGDPLDMDYWSLQATLQASDIQTNDQFGYSVALSGDSLIVGAANKAGGAGGVYFFERLGTSWTQKAGFVGGLGDRLGTDVDVFGGTAIAGAPGENQAIVYEYNGVTWLTSEIIQGNAPGTGLFGEFGSSVAIDQDTIAVGAASATVSGSPGQSGAVAVYIDGGTKFNLQQILTAGMDAAGNDRFGSAVDLSGDELIVGAPNKLGATGAAYTYGRVGTVWGDEQKLFLASGATDDFFGAAVAIDGTELIVGAYGRERAVRRQRGRGLCLPLQARRLDARDDPGSVARWGRLRRR